MPTENTRFPEPKEIVGSKDLREVFEENNNLQGSFFINGVEFAQFNANTPASVVNQINAKTGATHVRAEIDDQGHLVLIDRSGADIAIRKGAPNASTMPMASGDAVKDFVAAMRYVRDEEKREEEGDLLEMLGLEATEDGTGRDDMPVRPGFETGLSADDRRARWEEEVGLRIPGGNPAIGPTGGARRQDVPQIPSNPNPGNTVVDGKLDDGRGRTGTGGGSGETAGANVAAAHEGGSPSRAA